MARPPKAVEAHKLDGTYRADRHADRGVELDKIVNIKTPQGLTKEARKMWKMIIPPLCEAGIVSVIDYPALEEAFRCYGTAKQCYARAQSLANGDVSEYLQNLTRMDTNLMNEYLRHMERFDKIMVKFGMTPVERAKIRGSKKEKEKPTSPIGLLRSAGRG